MKRKNIQDFFLPVKKIKEEKQKNCERCGKNIENLMVAHDCVGRGKNWEAGKKNGFQVIMGTDQKTVKSNFHLEYTGKIEGKHKWKYEFVSPTSAVYHSKVHKLKLSSKDMSEIHLTFSTTHSGTRLHFYEMQPMPSLSPSILKSLLHKAIRRKNLKSALKTSLQLGVNCGIQELSRRLCVIELEDTFLHPDIPLLVWCMGVSDFEYSLEILESILQIVNDMVCINYVDILTEYPKVNVLEVWKNSNEMVKAILIRACYRGMAGDVKMLQNYAKMWQERFLDPKWSEALTDLYKNSEVWDLKNVLGVYSFGDTLLEGIDFHCSNMVEELLKNEKIAKAIERNTSQSPQEYLRSAIWNYRSKINFREPISRFVPVQNYFSLTETLPDPYDPVFTKVILPEVDIFSASELKKRFRTVSHPQKGIF